MRGHIAVVLHRPRAGYRVEFPNLPGCRCAAPSVEEALSKASRALAAYAANLRRLGLDMPPTRPSWAMIGETARWGAVAAACVRPRALRAAEAEAAAEAPLAPPVTAAAGAVSRYLAWR